MALSWKRIGAICGILGGLLFVLITIVNMLVYPGGYSFVDNYFSELGLTVVDSQPNMLGYILFSAACTSAAVCSIPYWLSVRTALTATNTLKYLGGLGTLLGLAAAPCLSALALFAGDVYPTQHGYATLLFFILYSLAISVYSIAMLLEEEYGILYSLIGFGVAAICLMYIFAIPGALMQKTAVYALVVWSAFQGYRLLQVFGKK